MRLAELHFFASSEASLRVLASERVGGPSLERTAACAPVFAAWRDYLADNFARLRQLEAAGWDTLEVRSQKSGVRTGFNAAAQKRGGAEIISISAPPRSVSHVDQPVTPSPFLTSDF
ncbi:MAG TPA: hypothetical protein VD886_14500 [Herpetosiphonaceae bacterium]|nr:hypothetical protein [Herpetosiphonaceae bacterium]